MDYVVEHWVQVERAKAMDEVALSSESVEPLAGSAAVALRLARRLKDKEA